MAEIIACPICTRKLRLPDEYTSREVRCPSCQTIFVPELPSTSFAAGASEVQNETLVQAVQAGIPDISRPDVTPELRADEEDVSQRIVHRDSSRKSSPRKMLVGAAAVLVAIAAMIGIMALVLKPVLDPPLAQRFEDDEQRREEVKAAFAEQKALDVDEIAKELMPLFDGLREAFQARNRKLILTHIDFDRMLDELTASGLLPAGVRLERHGFLRGVEKGMGPAMEEQAQFMQWTAHEIKSIKKLQGNEAVVIVRHKTDDGFTMKMRWWVSKRSGSWRVFDYEDLDAGMRVTTLVASMGEIGLAGVPAATGAIKNLQKAMVAIAMQRDPDTAERHLRAAQGAKLPRQLEALRSLVKALIHLQRNQSKEALAEIEVTQGLHPDMPMLDFLKTVAFNNLGEYDKALKHIEAYRALLGEDSGICFELAEALHGLQRFAEAIAAYRRSLDYDARNGDAFLGLVRALGPDDDRTELAKRFAKLDRHRENFDVCADDCRQARDGAGLEQIALAMRKIDPNYEPATYHLGLAKLWLGKADEAAPIFQAALAKEKNAARRQDYLQGYMQAMVDRGMALDGYAALPDAREAFAGLAAELKQSFRFDDLRRLIALHGKKDGADPLLLLYQGELHVQDGRYDLADKTFREAATKKLEATALARFVSSRVAARYHTSGAMSAYADFGPARETFQQLAQLCLDDDRDSQLQALLEAHAKNDPHDELIFSHRVRVAGGQD